MALFTILLGAVLTLLGVISYLATGMVSVTALIPAFFGVPLIALGIMGRNPARRMLAMHIAVTVALIGFFGSVRGLPGFIHLLQGAEVARPAAAVVQTTMAVLSIVYVAAAIRSFVAARLRRAAENGRD